MAISKLIPIKKTLNKAIDYIINPKKTDNGLLLSSFGCSVETADIEMQITASKGSEQGNRIAYHLLQSFSPEDDITPEKALELGKEFANKVTGGKYEYVIATHIDQGHIHNHIIFNAVSFTNRKKYHSDKSDKYRIRRINDRICKANHLSVIEKASGKKGHGKYEDMQRKEKNSWKQILENMIDSTIAKVSDFEEFRQQMELEGYEIKEGMHISFRAPGQESFCRGKTIGAAYTEAAIRERIANKELQKESFAQKSSEGKEAKTTSKKNRQPRRINLIVDISQNIKAQQSKGYEQALVKENLNTMVKTMNHLIRHGIKTPEEFEKHYSEVITEFDFLKRSRKDISMEMLDLSERIKFTQSYKKNKKVYFQSLKADNKQEFYREHEEELIQYKAALIYFEKAGISGDKQNLHNLFEEYRRLKAEKAELNNRFKEVKEKKYDLDIIRQNIEYVLELRTKKEEHEAKISPEQERNPQRNDPR